MPDALTALRSRRRSIILGMLAPVGIAFSAAASSDAASTDVWVDLTEPVPAGARDEAQAQQRRLRVAAQQDRVAQRLREIGVLELARTTHARNAILVRITAQQTQPVLDIPGVRRLRPSQSLHPPKTMP